MFTLLFKETCDMRLQWFLLLHSSNNHGVFPPVLILLFAKEVVEVMGGACTVCLPSCILLT